MHQDLSQVSAAIADRLGWESFLVISTGAGMSRESGIPTFRGAEGIWRNYRAEDVATPAAFARDPKLFWEFQDRLRQMVAAAAPNAGHVALAQLQQSLALGMECRVITQNVDRLHEQAGSRDVIHLHGDIIRVRCRACGARHDDYPVPAPELPPVCECGDLLRPDVVLFNEVLPERELAEAMRLAEACEVMLVVGTSVNVQPAASLPFIARDHGALVVEVNPTETLLTAHADYSLRSTAAEMLPPLCDLMLQELNR